MLLDILNIQTTALEHELFTDKKVSVAVVRLDKIHPVISGNKLFKLHYFLQEALLSKHTAVITFGGAYSNHLAATAYAGKLSGLKTIGIVRGEKASSLSHTLQFCLDNGMQLKFISRNDYLKKDEPQFLNALTNEMGNAVIIPEGGYHPLGAKGAALIMDKIDRSFTHIGCATGTATTVAGLLLNTEDHQQIISIPVLKGMDDIKERILSLTGNAVNLRRLSILDEYHFGGYAKSNAGLFDFMNMLYRHYQLPSDFVYTGKMLFGIFDAVKKDTFPKGSKIACLHTGGLQGNASLPAGTLLF